MKKEKLNVIDFLQKNTGWIVTLIGSGLAVFSSIFVLITTFENKLKSIYYHVDFLFYKNSFNFYQLILYFLFILICWQVVFSLKKVILFVYDKLINKKNIIFPKLDLLFSIPFFLLILVLLFIDWLLSFYLLFYFLLFNCSLFFEIFKYRYKI